jgi:hypothetical protein
VKPFEMTWEAKAISAEHVEQRNVFGEVRDSRPRPDLDKRPSFGGELAGVVTADDAADSAELEEVEWRRPEKGSLILGNRKLGKTGFVAEMPLSRTISAVVMLAIPGTPQGCCLLEDVCRQDRSSDGDFLELSMEGLGV